MNFRLTATLFGVVAVLVASLLYVSLTQQDKTKQVDGPLASLSQAGVKVEEIDTIELTRTQPTEEKIVFKKQDKQWKIASEGGTRCEDTAVEAMVQELFKLQPTKYADALDNLTQLELSQPTVTVLVKAGEKSAGVNIGRSSIGGDQPVTFVTSTDDAKRAYAVRTADLLSLFKANPRNTEQHAYHRVKWANDFRKRRLTNLDNMNPLNDLASLTVTRGDKSFSIENKITNWNFTKPESYGRADIAGDSAPNPLQFTGLRPLINALVQLQVGGPDDFLPTAELATYGLADTDVGRVTVQLKYKAKPEDVLYLGKKVERDGKPITPTRLYARLGSEAVVRLITTDKLEAFVNTVSDPSVLRNRDLISDTAKDTIDAIDSTFGTGVQLRRVNIGTEPKWALYGQGTPLDATRPMVDFLLTQLCQPRVAIDVLLQPNDALFAKPVGQLKVWFNGVPKQTGLTAFPAEIKLHGEPTVFTFGQSEKNVIYVRRTDAGQVTDFAVPVSLLGPVSASRVMLIDPKLGGYAVPQAKSVVTLRGTERTEFQKEAAADPGYPRGGKWRIVAPEPRKGQTADGDLMALVLDRLAGLAGARLIEESPSDERLKALGISPVAPTYSIKTAGVEDNEKEREYHFGNFNEDKSGVYFRVVGKPFVFLADAATVEFITKADYSDKVLARLDVDKIKALYLAGWKRTGATVGVDIEYLNNVWTARDSKTATVDEDQVKKILQAVEAPKKIKDLTVAAGELPPSEFGFNEFSTTIIVEMQDKSLLRMTIGAESPEKGGFFAQVNGQYVLLDGTKMRLAMEKSPLLKK